MHHRLLGKLLFALRLVNNASIIAPIVGIASKKLPSKSGGVEVVQISISSWRSPIRYRFFF